MGIHQNNGKSFSRRRLPQREIAAAAGVSISTVSRVLNHADTMSPDIKERVLLAASRLGYPLETTTLDTITIFMAPITTSTIADQFEAGIVAGIEAECRKHDIHLGRMHIESGADVTRFLHETLRRNKRDAFIFLSQNDQDLLAEAYAISHRLVLINADNGELPIDAIISNNTIGARLAVQHLIQHGHTHILHVGSSLRPTLRMRHASYRATLEAANIPYDLALVLMLDGPLRAETAYEQMQIFLAAPHPAFTAIFCVNDGSAIGVARALQEAGLRIPQDVSLIGFDDIDFVAFMNPPLTTIHVERAELGKMAVRRLLERSEEPHLPPIRIEVGCRLVERQSVAPAK